MEKMNSFNKHFIIVILLLSASSTWAQEGLGNRTQVEVGFGIVLPQLYGGSELIRSQELRDQGLSYFENQSGNRRQVGDYGPLAGHLIQLGFYKPVKFAERLMFGAITRFALTGSQPDIGGYDEGYFFNFVSTGFAAKYYPVEGTNIYLKTDVGVASVFTKNRFINEGNEQNFFHQFGIGPGVGIETGFSFSISKSKPNYVETKFGYQYANTRVEVNGIGDDPWRFGALYFATSIIF